MKNYVVFRVLLKMYKTDSGHFFFSVTISSKLSHETTDSWVQNSGEVVHVDVL